MSISVNVVEAIKNTGCEVELNVCLATYTSFKIGGNCRYIIKPNTITQIEQVILVLKQNQIPYYFLGNGSNVLVSDDGYDGAIILLSNQFANITLLDNQTIECEAGITLTKLCHFALEHSLSGLEFAFGIPGTVGGAVYMNAGAYGGEIKDVIESCTYLDENNQVKTINKCDMNLSYRHSIFTNTKCCILKAVFKCNIESKSSIKEKMDDYITRRKTKQPLEYPSAGSTFKRPVGNYASALIEQCGLKGYSVGGAMVSTKHSGFVINTGYATCKDVLTLVDDIKNIVLEKTGYVLDCEIKTLGF